MLHLNIGSKLCINTEYYLNELKMFPILCSMEADAIFSDPLLLSFCPHSW